MRHSPLLDVQNWPELKMEQNTPTKALILSSAIMTILAGIIHLVLVSAHMEHAPAHGLFFLLVGIAQITWGVLVWNRPSLRLYYIGAVMAGWLIILYGVTRFLPAPFSHGPEALETIDVVCKLCEALGMISLLILIFQGLLLHASRLNAWGAISLILVVSVLAGFVTYGIARAAEPILPWLAGPAEEHHHNENAPLPEEEDHHDESLLATDSSANANNRFISFPCGYVQISRSCPSVMVS
jgi:hypothetical protein